jgi:hypothetical protein
VIERAARPPAGLATAHRISGALPGSQTYSFLSLSLLFTSSLQVGALRCARPHSGCIAEQRDEVPPLHSITSSARASTDGGTSISSALAVCRLIMNSNVLARITGRSAGIAPLRMRPV